MISPASIIYTVAPVYPNILAAAIVAIGNAPPPLVPASTSCTQTTLTLGGSANGYDAVIDASKNRTIPIVRTLIFSA